MSDVMKHLCEAAAQNNLETAESIIASHPEILHPAHVQNPREGEAAPYQGLGVGHSPLLSAVGANHRQMVQLLLENGANPDEHLGYNCGMPLQKAVWENYSDIANLLLDFGSERGKSTAMAGTEVTG